MKESPHVRSAVILSEGRNYYPVRTEHAAIIYLCHLGIFIIFFIYLKYGPALIIMGNSVIFKKGVSFHE